tara:strand:+ start:137 stop:403 length:267 start_codon:yes stop_codon:yes gene_type:complete
MRFNELTPAEIIKCEKLVDAGFDRPASRVLAKELTDDQLSKATRLRRSSIIDWFAVKVAKEFTDKQIDTMIKLKENGLRVKQAYEKSL